jgi:hypothetical protein
LIITILGASASAACGGGVEGAPDSEIAEGDIAHSKQAVTAAPAPAPAGPSQDLQREVEAFRGAAFFGPVKLAEPANRLAAPEAITAIGGVSATYDPEAAARGAAFVEEMKAAK